MTKLHHISVTHIHVYLFAFAMTQSKIHGIIPLSSHIIGDVFKIA